MSRALVAAALATAALLSACIAPSVVAKEDRAVRAASESVEWAPATAEDVPGRYVSTELSGPLAAALRMVVYLFQADGHYTGAGLIDDDPPHFEVIRGRWELGADGFVLDGGAPATIEVSPDGALRLTGDEGSVILRRERER